MLQAILTLPNWLQNYMAVCLVVGVLVTTVAICFMLRPLARGLSYGMYETVMYYRGGAKIRYVVVQFFNGLIFEPLRWLGKSNMQSISNNMTSWSGVFSWSFKKEFTRANSKKYNAEQKAEREAAAKNPEPQYIWDKSPADDDDFGSDFDSK